ncbi:hypothetical protein ATSB10_02650 [Dyella thiooxydans]|uniref:Beta-lactamase-related domain-containing protein n=1 Tax=Dyella thiooxydans TaxID=445710 RepID=A0A161JIJ7_9GAMM|nr:serine hydrolase [Dyella thiooxydans]AND67719.1 hypothetical protein ATSB10_02650 [Dyella thiooxydans]
MRRWPLDACLATLLLLGATALQARGTLDFKAMQSGQGYRSSVDLSAFAPDEASLPATHRFEGRLQLSGQPQTRTLLADTDFLAFTEADYRQARTIPQDFDYAFVQDKDTLIPVRRGPIPSDHPWWEFILEPGKVWDEPGDRGYTRAAIPFSLAQKNQNCTSNGVLMLLFNAQGALAHAAFQVSSETCRYLHMDMWGFLQARYLPGAVANKAAIVAAYRTELAARLPTRPLSALKAAYPDLDLARLAIGDPTARTRYGLYVDGVDYASPCPTRHGDYPYCQVMDLPSYSTAKTIVAGIAAMRMQQRWPGVMQQHVGDYAPTPACAAARWRDVSFMNLLDMASGNYGSADYMADEDSPKVAALLRPLTNAGKLRAACSSWPRSAPPGSRWVYHTSDTYLLGIMLNRFLRTQTGQADLDVFSSVLLPDVLAPLQLSPTARVSRRTLDTDAQPFFGYGLFVHADDFIKLARFLDTDHGRMDGRQILDPQMLDAAMQRNPEQRGLPVTSLEQTFRYQHAVWARNVQKLLNCKTAAWVPFMSGYGGITVAMFPNGVVWYNVADDGKPASFDFADPAREINKIRGYCPG